MRRIALTALVGAALAGAAASAHSAPALLYVRVDAGGSFPTGSAFSSFDPSPLVGVGAGFSPLPFLRTDFTISYRSDYQGSLPVTGTPLTAKTDIRSVVGMVNAYYDFPTLAAFTPYVGGGAGVARNEFGATSLSAGGVAAGTARSAVKTNFAWQVGGGVAFSVLPTIALDIAYHYLDAGRLASTTIAGSSASARLKAHEVTAGLRVGF